MDIKTGRLRFTRYLAFCKVSERVVDSTLSLVLPREMVAASKPEWRRVNTFSPGVRHSPHHGFHGAISQIRLLALIWEASAVEDPIKRKLALHVLALWQYDGSDRLVDRYFDGLNDVYDGSKKERILRSLATLEMPLDRIEGDRVVRTVFYPDGSPMERVRGVLDSDGHLVRHGTWERWHADGRREVYGHLDKGEYHGRRFSWDQDGKLIAIESFSHGESAEFAWERLEHHPDFETARQLAGQADQPR